MPLMKEKKNMLGVDRSRDIGTGARGVSTRLRNTSENCVTK